MELRLYCKRHDEHEVVIAVGVEGRGIFPIIAVWNAIMNKEYTFYTFERGIKAQVYARQREGTKYLTTHPDGITANNLDELPTCP